LLDADRGGLRLVERLSAILCGARGGNSAARRLTADTDGYPSLRAN
jgi:hypothetical protein